MSSVGQLERNPSNSRDDDPLSNISRIPGLADLHRETRGDPSVCIAILDGPVALAHGCFAGADLATVGGLPADLQGSGGAFLHGTHVASVVFGQARTCVEGIAPGCRGLLIPVFTDGPDGSIAPCSEMDLARAIALATERGADIINISGGRLAHAGEAGQFLTDAVKQSADQGVLVVAAGGNDGCDCLHVPAALPNVIAVGAMDIQGRPLESSNWGHRYLEQGILALGQGIRGATSNGGVTTLTGTSFATPVVSGVAGLLLSLQRLRGELPDVGIVRDAILTTVTACDPQSSDDCQRHLVGTLNVSAARNAIIRGAGRGPPEWLAASNIGRTVPSVSDLGRRNSMSSVGEAHISIQPSSSTPEQGASPEGPPPQVGNAGAVTGSDAAEIPMTTGDPARPVSASGTATAAQASPATTTAPELAGETIAPSSCCAECAVGQKQLVYALGTVGYDFGTEARCDFFAQMMPSNAANPFVPQQLLSYFEAHPYDASSVIWTLNLDATPIYAIQPAGPYSAIAYERLREFLAAQAEEGVDFVSIPGFVGGSVRLFSGQVVPEIVPAVSGMFSWSMPALVQHVFGARPKDADKVKLYDEQAERLGGFLSRVYYDLRNLGISADQRALNYSATNAVQVATVMRSVVSNKLDLDRIKIMKSPVCRPESDCYDVELSFFDPNNIYAANQIFRFTVDVSDVVPVTIGTVRSWWRRI